MVKWHIRPYQPADRAAVFQLCGDTTHFGDPIERFFDARDLFLDTFAAYYTDVAGDHLWVAAADSAAADCAGVLAYLMGCPDTRAYYRWFRPHTRRIAWRALTGQYRGLVTRKTLAYIWRYARLRVPYLDLSPYPAHLHLNTRTEWRGLGLGTALMSAYLDQLRREHVPGVQLETSSENKIAAPWYERLGFQLLQRTPTNLYQPSVGQTIDLLVYAKRL